MDTGKDCCGGSCACSDAKETHPSGAELTTKVCCGASAVCASHFGHESDDDGFGDYVGADHDRVMRDRDRSRVESTLEKVRHNSFLFGPFQWTVSLTRLF